LLLLDTCTFLWLTTDPAKLGRRAAAAIEADSVLLLSDASVWEICLKWQAKKLVLPSPPRAWVAEQVRTWELERAALEHEHFYRTVELPDLHRDPFDRLLVAQSLVLGAPIVTPDPAIRAYPVAVIW
jgi:PIN domain nuclease of toxin-antitoxin system